MNKLLFIPLLFICFLAEAGEYVCYDKDGTIVSKHYSVSKEPVGQCIKVSREKFKALTQYSKVNTSVFNMAEVKDSKIVEMTKEEIDAIKAPILAEEKEREDKIIALRTKLKELGLTDEEVTMVISSY